MGVQFDASSGTLGANNNTVGWRFKAGQDITVTRLGCLNGVVTTDDTRAGVAHAVGIYSEATGQLLGSAVVVNGAAGSTDQWLWTDLATPITLTAGNIYRIAANPNGDKWTYNTANHSVGPGILIGTDLAPGVPLTDNPGSRVAAYEAGNKLQYPAQLLWDVDSDLRRHLRPQLQVRGRRSSRTARRPRDRHAPDRGYRALAAGEQPDCSRQRARSVIPFPGAPLRRRGAAQLPDGMNNGVMTAANDAARTILAWDGVTANFGWAVYVLDTTTNTLGYDVSEILSYAGFTGARINQAVEIKYALVGDTITEGSELQHTLGSFSYSPSDNTNGYDYSILSITNDDGPTVLSGISAIEVKYIDNLFNGTYTVLWGSGNYTAYKQFAVIGSATTSDARRRRTATARSTPRTPRFSGPTGWPPASAGARAISTETTRSTIATRPFWPPTGRPARRGIRARTVDVGRLAGLCLAGLSGLRAATKPRDAQTMSGNSGNAL